ncbi:hypothetical protein BDZ94DRAFT_1252957 [Collybia nuda]|uniref:Uncharacterized protein n=1 Tax=Collybia nuda TaxID=64659 RepID=A0A9P6CMH2_9AGAR|nr:hypothetical protein BDZ94DRAFT_1252957 [Collybia nuda]
MLASYIRRALSSSYLVRALQSGMTPLDAVRLAIETDGLLWTGLWIFLLSICFTYSVSSLGHPPRTPPPPTIKVPRNRIIEAQKRRLEITRAIERENARLLALEKGLKGGFPFLTLPLEIQFLVLSHSSDWISTYQSLICVSRHMYLSTLRGCLPHMAITLCTMRQVSSFFDILHSHPDVALLVHHLWVAPLRREDIRLGHTILRACTNVRVLACDARSLFVAVAKPSKFKHTMCRDLTLLLSRPQWEIHLNMPSGISFISQLTRLRVMSEGTVPRMLRFPKITQLSYVDRPPLNPSAVEYPWALDRPDILPSLQTVILTRRCGPPQRPPERIGPRLVVLHISREVVEMQNWCDGVRGKSLWDEAALIPLIDQSRGDVKVII